MNQGFQGHHKLNWSDSNRKWGFNPALPVSGQATLYAAVATPACGDNFTDPAGYPSAPTSCEIYGADRNLRTPFVTNWNIDLQEAITSNLFADIVYAGNHSSNLLGKTNINQPQFVNGFSAGWGDFAVGDSVLAPPPFGSYGSTTQNMFCDAGIKNWDFSVAKAFRIKEQFKAEFWAE